MRYRPEVDGLRAVAVVPVILFHAGFDKLGGGFVGVDIFFVISGYLITKLIYPEIRDGTFSLVDFYERRARRILPALILVCLACLPFAWAWLLPRDLQEFSESLAAVSVFASNVYFWLRSDYFAAPAATMPLLHTWSLGVEEQFYLLFPLSLLALRRARSRTVFGSILLVSILSLAMAVYAGPSYPAANFYLAPTRAWELGVGALLAISDGRWTIRRPALRELIGLAAAASIVYSILAFDERAPHPGITMLLPVIGAAALIATATPQTIVGRLLSSRPFVSLGLISYSAYLWHQPLFAFARYQTLGELSASLALFLSACTLVLAYFSWRFVEQPFRRRDVTSRRQVFSLAASGTLLMMVLGAIGTATEGFKSRFDSVATLFPAYETDNEKLEDESRRPLRSVAGDDDYRVEGNSADQNLWFSTAGGRTKILIVGNSHSKDLFNVLALNPQFSADFEFARYGTQVACLDADGDDAFYRSSNYRSADIVIVSTRWRRSGHCGGTRSDFEGLENLAAVTRRDGKLLAVSSQSLDFPQRGYYTLADVEVFAAAKAAKAADGVDRQAVVDSINQRHFELRNAARRATRTNARLRALADEHGLIYLDKEQYLCDQARRRCLGITADFRKTFYDYGHYTIDGAREFGRRAYSVNWLREVTAAVRADER